MADREQSHTSKRGMDEKPQRDIAGTRTSGSQGEEREQSRPGSAVEDGHGEWG